MIDGYGFYRTDDGRLMRKRNLFCDIVIEDGVEIALNTNIDPGSYRPTTIGEGSKIDSMVHIGHNVIIGKHTLVIACSALGGSVEIGDYCYIGLNSTIKDHIKIGNHVIVGAGSVVVKDIPDNDIVAGNPAVSIKGKTSINSKDRFNMIGNVS